MKSVNCSKNFIVLIFTLLCVSSTYAQREKNNIYLFDCTGSMRSNGLWQPAKAALDATIATQASIPGSQVTVIPFGDNPYGVFSFLAAQYNDKKDKIFAAFDKYIGEAKFTHITDVLLSGFSKVDPNRENRIYLLTDGMPNSGDSPDRVAKTIKNWCGNHRNCRLFYVALTNGVINPIIRQAIDECPDAFIVQCDNRVIPQIADISSDIYTNIEELDHQNEITFSLPGRYKLDVVSDDPIFNVVVKDNVASNGKIYVSLCPKNGWDISKLHRQMEGTDYEFPIRLQCADKRFFIANPVVQIHVADEMPAQLDLMQGNEELFADGVSWYDSFLWSNASADEKIEWDLTPMFKNELANSALTLRFDVPEKEAEDFKAWYNGEPLKRGQHILIKPGQPSVIQLQFNHQAKVGKRYFSLIPVSHSGLDMINHIPIDEYKGASLRTEYNISWNPLKTLLFWIGIIFLIALILWLLIFKRIVFPIIRVSKVEIMGPGQYYASKRIRGARKVVLTSKKQSQNIFSRIFTGEIRYIRAEHFSPELAIIPAAGKKRIKLSVPGKSTSMWNVYPSAIFSQYEKGTITNTTTKDKSEIEFS